MCSRCIKGFSLLFFVLAMGWYSPSPAAELTDNEAPHHFQLSCEICHVVVRPLESQNDATSGPSTEPPEVGNMFRDINRACTWSGCHDFASSLSHPVGVKPSGKTPPNMPLDRHSRLTCLTCHDELGRTDDTFSNAYFLRQPPDQQLCLSCHQNLGKSIQERSHWQFTTRAHLGGDRRQTTFNQNIFPTFKENIAGIDPESYSCLRCHDDKASIVSDDVGSPGLKSIRSGYANHPIGMAYEKRMIRKPADFNSPRAMAPGVRLVNGLVGCVSCHNMYGDNPQKLSVRNDRDALCKSCHNK